LRAGINLYIYDFISKIDMLYINLISTSSQANKAIVEEWEKVK